MCCMCLAENTGCKKSPSVHHCTTSSGYIFASKACIDNQKKSVKQHLLHRSSQYGKFRPTSGWDRLLSFGHPSKFQEVSRLGFVTVATALNGNQPNFARYWDWYTIYIHFWGLLSPNGILPGAKFTFVSKSCVLLFWQCYCTALKQWLSDKLRCGTRNGIIERLLLIIFNKGRHLYSEGGHHNGHRPTI